MLRLAILIILFATAISFNVPRMPLRLLGRIMAEVKYDAQGYVIKDRDWFNGLSMDPGASLTDPRAVPPPVREFVEKIKGGGEVGSLAETLKLIDEHYDYFEVPFQNGALLNKANENIASSKIFSLGLLTRMDEKATLRLFSDVYRNLTPEGTDHANVRNFIKNGWPGVVFSSGLSIISKLQAYDDTDSAFKTQASVEGATGWDTDSDSWIP